MPLTPSTFFASQLLHQTTFTPDTFYTRHLYHPFCQTPLYNKRLLHHTTFTPNSLGTRQLLHQGPFTPDTVYTRNFLHQKLFLHFTEHPLHRKPWHAPLCLHDLPLDAVVCCGVVRYNEPKGFPPSEECAEAVTLTAGH